MTATSAADQAKRLDDAMWKLDGITYMLNALAEERTEATNALRNLARQADEVFVVIEGVAKELCAEE